MLHDILNNIIQINCGISLYGTLLCVITALRDTMAKCKKMRRKRDRLAKWPVVLHYVKDGSSEHGRYNFSSFTKIIGRDGHASALVYKSVIAIAKL